jgi:hypothetical protein
MDEKRQATFGADGTLETDRPPEATGEDDFGERKDPDETDGGFSRYAVSSLLQKAVRRSDEEVAAWAAWELARSGFGWNLWERLNLYVVEDLRAGQDVATQVARYEELATERWEPDEWRGRICAVHAALACARATSSREAANADDYFGAVAAHRADARERGEDPVHDFPVGDIEAGGRFDAAVDGHTAEGSRRGRGTAFFKTRGARVGPEGESDPSARWQRLAMALSDVEFDERDVERALTPTDADDPWRHPDADGGGGDHGDGDDADDGVRGP